MPLSLNDDEYNAVQAAAAPIHPLQRDAFLKALAVELERHPVVGPGLVHRVAAELQKTSAWWRTVKRCSRPREGAPGGALSQARALRARRQAVRSCWSLWLCGQCSPRSTTIGERNMTTVFIEARPKGRPEGSAIEDYVVEEQGGSRPEDISGPKKRR